MKTAVLILSAILFWQGIHAAPFNLAGSGSNKILSSKVSQIAEYNETAIEEILQDPRCSADRLWDTAKCACFMTWMEGALTTDVHSLCKETFEKDPSELNACSSFTNNGVLDKEEATKDAENVVEECFSGRFDEESSSTTAARMYSMYHDSVRIRSLSCFRRIKRIIEDTVNRLKRRPPVPRPRPRPRPPTPRPRPRPSTPTPRPRPPGPWHIDPPIDPDTPTPTPTPTPTETPEPSPSDASRMLTQEFARRFSPKTAKLLSYNS